MKRTFAKYPPPWRYVGDESVDPDKYAGGFDVYDAEGKAVIRGGTYSGDGDAEFNLDRLQALELVELVNGQAHACPQTKTR